MPQRSYCVQKHLIKKQVHQFALNKIYSFDVTSFLQHEQSFCFSPDFAFLYNSHPSFTHFKVCYFPILSCYPFAFSALLVSTRAARRHKMLSRRKVKEEMIEIGLQPTFNTTHTSYSIHCNIFLTLMLSVFQQCWCVKFRRINTGMFWTFKV